MCDHPYLISTSADRDRNRDPDRDRARTRTRAYAMYSQRLGRPEVPVRGGDKGRAQASTRRGHLERQSRETQPSRRTGALDSSPRPARNTPPPTPISRQDHGRERDGESGKRRSSQAAGGRPEPETDLGRKETRCYVCGRHLPSPTRASYQCQDCPKSLCSHCVINASVADPGHAYRPMVTENPSLRGQSYSCFICQAGLCDVRYAYGDCVDEVNFCSDCRYIHVAGHQLVEFPVRGQRGRDSTDNGGGNHEDTDQGSEAGRARHRQSTGEGRVAQRPSARRDARYAEIPRGPRGDDESTR